MQLITYLRTYLLLLLTDRSVLLTILSGVLKENASMTDRQCVTGHGVNGQTIQTVHITVGVVHSTEHEPALIQREYFSSLI